jgi:hypothetical protein
VKMRQKSRHRDDRIPAKFIPKREQVTKPDTIQPIQQGPIRTPLLNLEPHSRISDINRISNRHGIPHIFGRRDFVFDMGMIEMCFLIKGGKVKAFEPYRPGLGLIGGEAMGDVDFVAAGQSFVAFLYKFEVYTYQLLTSSYVGGWEMGGAGYLTSMVKKSRVS